MDEFCPISLPFLWKCDDYVVSERSRAPLLARLLGGYFTLFLKLCENLLVVAVDIGFADAMRLVKLPKGHHFARTVFQQHSFQVIERARHFKQKRIFLVRRTVLES